MIFKILYESLLDFKLSLLMTRKQNMKTKEKYLGFTSFNKENSCWLNFHRTTICDLPYSDLKHCSLFSLSLPWMWLTSYFKIFLIMHCYWVNACKDGMWQLGFSLIHTLSQQYSQNSHLTYVASELFSVLIFLLFVSLMIGTLDN